MVNAVSGSRWPPRSPREALLSSPSGRNRVRQFNDRTSPSPSPLKKSATTPNPRSLQHKPRAPTAEEDDDEDEETLQLRLDAIEARLKLKKLQQKRAKVASTTSDIENERPEDLRPRSSSCLQIPVSPTRKQLPTEEKKSPGRILLGIDKGLKGRNVSLKRPPDREGANEDPFSSKRRAGSSRASVLSNTTSNSYRAPDQRPQSFSDRIAESRRQDKESKDRVNRARNQRSAGFGIQQDEIERLKTAAIGQDDGITQLRNDSNARAFSRDELMRAVNQPNRGVPRSKSNSDYAGHVRRSEVPTSTPRGSSNTSKPSQTSRPNPSNAARSPSPATEPLPSSTTPPPEPSDALFEPFSTLHLSKRILPHKVLTRTFASRPVLTIPSLLSQIKSPAYELPATLDSDFIVLAIIASKSSPLSHRDAHKSTASDTTPMAEAAESETNARGKYMVLTLTDLKWTLDLYLFTTAYTRFWKLTPGTVIAILNPNIMPPPPGKQDTGRFSLVLNSSDDTVLEIGTSRDLGWCKSVKRDGKQCGSWIDKRHTSVCEFHVDRVVERTRAGRMEVNTMSGSYGPKGRGGGRTGFWGGSKKMKGKDDGLLPANGAHYDRGLGTQYFVAPGSRQSAARLLDAEGGLERGGSREERDRKRRAEQEKEREIARKLGEGGNGMAAEYLRRKHDPEKFSATGQDQMQQSVEPIDVVALGLVGKKARDVHLSPVKKRKAGMGAQDERKKTRFVTKEGIKEAGRESGGGDVWLDAAVEDDELDIV